MRTVSVPLDYFMRTVRVLEQTKVAWRESVSFREPYGQHLYCEAIDILDQAHQLIDDFYTQERGEIPALEFEHEGFRGHVLHNGQGVSWAGRYFPKEDASPDLLRKVEETVDNYLRMVKRGPYHA